MDIGDHINHDKTSDTFCILPQHRGQKPAERPWSEASIRYTSALGSYPRDHRPSPAPVVLHDSEVYRPSEWGWDLRDWTRIQKGTIGEKIKVGCRKVEGSLYEKASTIAIEPYVMLQCIRYSLSLH